MARQTIIRKKDIVIASSLAVLDLAAVLLVQFLVIAPATSRAADAREQLAAAVRQLEDNNNKRRTLAAISQEKTKLEEKVAVFDQRIPKKDETVGLLADILQAAGKTPVKIIGTQNLPPGPIGQGYHRIPHEFTVEGAYPALARFLNTVETHERFIDIAGLAFTAASGDELRLKATLYFYTIDKSAPEAPSAAPAPPKMAARR